jgi:hypothetical protein
MPRCPYAPHRLFSQGGACRRCGGDVRLYTAVQSLPIGLFNNARRLWEQHDPEAAAAVLAEALRLRPEFAEAHWLLAAIEAARGRRSEAHASLVEAARLGAAVDLSWVDVPRSDVLVAPEPLPDDVISLTSPPTEAAPPHLEGSSEMPPDATDIQAPVESTPAAVEAQNAQSAVHVGGWLGKLLSVFRPADVTTGEAGSSSSVLKE